MKRDSFRFQLSELADLKKNPPSWMDADPGTHQDWSKAKMNSSKKDQKVPGNVCEASDFPVSEIRMFQDTFKLMGLWPF